MQPKPPFVFMVTLVFFVVATAKPQTPANGGSVSGKILCEDTHTPAREAHVSLLAPFSNQPGALLPREAFGTSTGVDGSFTISNVAPGEYYVVTSYPGYISSKEYIFPGALSPELSGTRDPLPSFVQRVAVVSGDTKYVEMRLKRGASIIGTVSNSDGAAVPNVALTSLVKLRDGDFREASTGSSHTDSSGDYRIDGLADGSYVILGAMEGAMVPVFGGGQIGATALIVFAGGGMRPSKARIIDVRAPKEYADVNITIALTGVHEVGGVVAAPDRHPLNRGLVRLYPTGEPRFSLATPLKPDGTFSFHRIPPDSYTIIVADASDWKLSPNNDVGRRYDVQNYRPASVDVTVADVDLTNVSITASPVR
jgi:hypothetical protein